MSGGSYDYLSCASADELMHRESDLERMADRLIELGYERAGKETLDVLYDVRRFRRRLEVQQKRLDGVWHEVEWYDSCDTSEKTFREAMAELEADE